MQGVAGLKGDYRMYPVPVLLQHGRGLILGRKFDGGGAGQGVRIPGRHAPRHIVRAARQQLGHARMTGIGRPINRRGLQQFIRTIAGADGNGPEGSAITALQAQSVPYRQRLAERLTDVEHHGNGPERAVTQTHVLQHGLPVRCIQVTLQWGKSAGQQQL